MKFMRALTLIYLIDLMVIFSVTLAQNWNHLGLRGVSQTNPGVNLNTDQSSSYPSYALPVYAGSQYAPSYYPSPQSLGNDYQLAANNGQNTAYGPQATYTAQNYGQSPNTIDVHQVLDQFIRSAGLSPQGDHESEAAHSSSFAKAGTSPVLVFKKLFSFPFYLSTNPNVVDIYGKNWK